MTLLYAVTRAQESGHVLVHMFLAQGVSGRASSTAHRISRRGRGTLPASGRAAVVWCIVLTGAGREIQYVRVPPVNHELSVKMTTDKAQYQPGECWFMPASLKSYELIPEDESSLIRTFVPDLNALRGNLRMLGIADGKMADLLFD